jgi:general secretion pathway protein G
MEWTQKQAQPGMTLIEIMVVILIMGLIIGGVGVGIMRQLGSARKSTAAQTLKVFRQAIRLYHLNTRRYPRILRDLVRKPNDTLVQKLWTGPYLEDDRIPLDPWNEDYVYRLTPNKKKPYELYSFGEGGKDTPKKDWISVWD